MFCSVKQGKNSLGNVYRFYLCERKRVNGKVKSSDKYIMTLQYIDLTEIKPRTINHLIIEIFKEEGFDTENSPEANLVFDKYTDLRSDVMDEEEARKREEFLKGEKEARDHAKFQQDFKNNYKYSSDNLKLHYTEEEKEYLKKFYKVLAMKFHPDVCKDDGYAMKLINQLKNEWNL